MGETLFRHESATEYFKELVESAIDHQHLTPHGLTSFYLVNLLTGFVHFDRSAVASDEEPLAVRFTRAMQAAGAKQRDSLREVGDESLFISGFFSDSLNKRPVDIDYYIQLGECAYASLARREDTLAEVFNELSEKFSSFVDVLGEVSEHSALTSNSDLLRLYEKWLRTGSKRSGDLLIARGIVPTVAVDSRFVH